MILKLIFVENILFIETIMHQAKLFWHQPFNRRVENICFKTKIKIDFSKFSYLFPSSCFFPAPPNERPLLPFPLLPGFPFWLLPGLRPPPLPPPPPLLLPTPLPPLWLFWPSEAAKRQARRTRARRSLTLVRFDLVEEVIPTTGLKLHQI